MFNHLSLATFVLAFSLSACSIFEKEEPKSAPAPVMKKSEEYVPPQLEAQPTGQIEEEPLPDIAP